MQSLTKLMATRETAVRIGPGFWGQRVEMVRETMLPYQHEALAGRVGGTAPSYAIRNFRIAAGKAKGEFKGPVFQDSDLAKWIEAAGHALAVRNDPVLERKADAVIRLIAAAQEEDGYLNTAFILKDRDKRWTNLRDCHELYCSGHFIEAAVAYFEGTGKRVLLDVMIRNVDLIASVFGRGRGKRRGYPGHEEIELALVKLYRVTGQRRFLSLAQYFIDERGRTPNYFAQEAKTRGGEPPWYGDHGLCRQAHRPVREQNTADGHAVRACYLYAGMADVAAETGDRALLKACKRLWRNITSRRMYIHGGIGSTRHGERFTVDYDLPNEEAYAETCAAIALVFFAQRLLSIEPDAEYADVIERALYNGILSGVSLDGTRFFYDNVLASYPAVQVLRGQKPAERQEWFGCACCPPNLARLFASLGSYLYAQNGRDLYVHHFVQGHADMQVGDVPVRLEQAHDYPWKGRIAIDVRPNSPVTFTLCVRIPGWCRGATAAVNGEPVELAAVTRKGYARIRRRWSEGDGLVLDLPMPVERAHAHPSVRENAGRVALQRGPLVYCLEQADNGPDLNAIVLPAEALLQTRFLPDRLGGVVVIEGDALRRDGKAWGQALYRGPAARLKPARIQAIPYAFWANRGAGEMLVWLVEGDGST